MPVQEWSALNHAARAKTLFTAFKQLAIVKKFTRNHFARAHKLPFAIPPFFAHLEKDYVVFRRGLGSSVALGCAQSEPYIRGNAATRSLKIALPYGKKSVVKIFSEKKLSPRERRRAIVYLDALGVGTRIEYGSPT